MFETIPVTDSTTVSRALQHQWRETQDHRILVFPRYQGQRPEFHGFYELGEFEAVVWRLLENPCTASALCDALSNQLTQTEDVEVPSRDEVWRELTEFLFELAGNGLVTLEKNDSQRPTTCVEVGSQIT